MKLQDILWAISGLDHCCFDPMGSNCHEWCEIWITPQVSGEEYFSKTLLRINSHIMHAKIQDEIHLHLILQHIKMFIPNFHDLLLNFSVVRNVRVLEFFPQHQKDGV